MLKHLNANNHLNFPACLQGWMDKNKGTCDDGFTFQLDFFGDGAILPIEQVHRSQSATIPAHASNQPVMPP